MEESAKNARTSVAAKAKAQLGDGSMFSQKIDEVSRNSIWREHCAKSSNPHAICTRYSLNPLTAIPIPEKPNRCHPSIKVTQEEYEEAKAFLGNIYTLKNTDLIPPQKYELPITTSHEYGWCSKPLVEPNRLLNYPHSSCEITKFAAKYQQLMHTTAFSKKDFIPDTKKKVSSAPGEGGATVLPIPESNSDSENISAKNLTASKISGILPEADADAVSLPASPDYMNADLNTSSLA